MAQRRIRPKRIAQLQRRFLREMGATPAEIRRYQPILTAQIGAESNFTEGIGSPAGARDIAQFMPGTARSYGVRLGDNRIKDDIRGQVKYMLPLLRKYGVEGALRGYNAGVGAIERSKGFSETNNYVSRIRSTAGEYRGMGAGAAGVEGESSGGGGRPGQYTIPGVDNSQLRQQAMLAYLDVRGKPGALLELKAALDSAQDVPSRQVKVPGSSLNNGPANSRNRGGRGNSSSQDVLRRTAGPTAKPGKIIGVPYSGTHTLGNWQSDNAVDIAVPMGTRITAATGGRIVKIHGGWHGGSDRFDGYQVTIEGPDGGLFYTHLRSVNVKVGQRVKRGQVIGRSGAANGVEHLHFGVQRGDPRRFVR